MKPSPHQTPRRLALTTIVAGVLLVLGGLGMQVLKHQRAAETAPQSTPPTETVIPAAAPELAAPAQPVCDVSTIEQQIQQFVALQAANEIDFAIGYYNINTGCEVYHNAQQQWIGASTTKVILALMVYEQVSAGTMQLEQLIRYDEALDYEAGAGSLQYQANLRDVTVQTLVDLMIIESDNIAKNMLLRTLGGREAMHTYVTQLTGLTVSDQTSNQIMAQQLTIVLKHLLDPTTPGSSEIQTLMAQTSDQTRIAASVNPDGSQPIIVHKIGDFNQDDILYLHDIAIVRTPTPYILTVMTRSQPESDAFVYDQITTLANQLNALHQ